MTHFQILRVIVGQPYLPAFILPDECFLGQVNRHRLAALHQGGTHFRIAENYQFRRTQLFSHFAGAFAVVDP